MESLLLAATLGLAAGVSPGPLLTLVIQATLARGFPAGLRVALAPLITDVPVVVIALLALDQAPASWLAALSLVGGVFVVATGVATWREEPPALVPASAPTAPEAAGFGASAVAPAVVPAGGRDLWRGALVNVLSPHPWLTWATVLGPQLVVLWRSDRVVATGFLLLFYVLLVGSKIVIAGLVARGRNRLSPRGYQLALRACALLLLVFGTLLIAHGLSVLQGSA